MVKNAKIMFMALNLVCVNGLIAGIDSNEFLIIGNNKNGVEACVDIKTSKGCLWVFHKNAYFSPKDSDCMSYVDNVQSEDVKKAAELAQAFLIKVSPENQNFFVQYKKDATGEVKSGSYLKKNLIKQQDTTFTTYESEELGHQDFEELLSIVRLMTK